MLTTWSAFPYLTRFVLVSLLSFYLQIFLDSDKFVRLGLSSLLSSCHDSIDVYRAGRQEPSDNPSPIWMSDGRSSTRTMKFYNSSSSLSTLLPKHCKSGLKPK